METSYNLLIAAALGLMIFSLTTVVSKQMSLLAAMQIWAAGVAAAAFAVWILFIRKYHHMMEELDRHLNNLGKGQPVPSLRELTKD